MGMINILKTKFGKKIYISEEELVESFCKNIRLKSKRLKINTGMIIPQNACAIACYKGKPCDILPSGEILLNAGSLPVLFKKCDYQGDIKKTGKVSNYFEVELYALSLDLHRLEFDVGKFVVKDTCYGKQKINLSISADVKVVDPMKFFKVLIHEHPNLKKKRVKDIVCDWIAFDTINLLKKMKFNIDDFMVYTSNINAQISENIIKRFGAVGIEVRDYKIVDVILPDELVREIETNRRMSFEIHTKISDFEAIMREDGYESQVRFVRDNEQTRESVFETNYQNPCGEVQSEDGLKINRQSYFSYGGVASFGKICQDCGREVPTEANFCPYCASRIKPDINTCDNCGANNISDADFCYNCGKKLS